MSFETLTPPDTPEEKIETGEAQLHVMELPGGTCALLAIDRQKLWHMIGQPSPPRTAWRIEIGKDEHAGTLRIALDPNGPHLAMLNNRSLVFNLGNAEALSHLSGTHRCLCVPGDEGEVLVRVPEDGDAEIGLPGHDPLIRVPPEGGVLLRHRQGDQ